MKHITIIAILAIIITGCMTTKVSRPESITLAEALKDVMKALNEMSEIESDQKHGLVPAEVTVTFNITASGKRNAGVSVAVVPTGIISEIPSIGGNYSAEVTGSRGNQIVIKFRNIMFATDKEIIFKKTPEQIDELFKKLKELGWSIKVN